MGVSETCDLKTFKITNGSGVTGKVKKMNFNILLF